MHAAKQLFSIVALSAFLTVVSAQARTGCSRNGTVQPNDTCDILCARDSVSTCVLSMNPQRTDFYGYPWKCSYQLAFANQAAIDPLCDNIFPGEVQLKHPRALFWCSQLMAVLYRIFAWDS